MLDNEHNNSTTLEDANAEAMAEAMTAAEEVAEEVAEDVAEDVAETLEKAQKLCILNFKDLQEYVPAFSRMQKFGQERTSDTIDQIWFLEHLPVFTQGNAGKAEHILSTSEIPVVQVDRGGQVTYHGPGQLVVYFLIDYKRKYKQLPDLNIRSLVDLIEQAILYILSKHGVQGHLIKGAPGIYIQEKKVSSLGLKYSRLSTSHGVAFNINMDLTPFLQINPCGYSGLEMCNLSDFVPDIRLAQVKEELKEFFIEHLSYSYVEEYLV